ncbi:hypothetical protein QWY22_03090 [Planococcus liqunii]|uniref:hypothetical protein n=1 Tax=Planococcus liqunii TaxID=3058394 RepID=UPI00262035B9|nr:hypothetical protein [Planococcus sp. N056]WKA51602.1 hypothetical protein QWY22_03090 [Planococcus sp. N056]
MKMDRLPPTLQKLKDFDKELERQGSSLDEWIGFSIVGDESRYNLTPLDVIPFAATGVDGNHFGLLTDFGMISNLEEAPIVCVTPMNFGEHVKIVARNLKEFLDLIYTVTDFSAIANFTYFQDKQDYRKLLNNLRNDETYEERVEKLESMKAEFGLHAIEDVYRFVEVELKEARQRQIALPTLDGLGVVAQKGNGDLPLYPVHEDMKIDIGDMRKFLAAAPVESRLAFIRDAQFTNILEEPEIKQLVLAELKRMDLPVERKRLNDNY